MALGFAICVGTCTSAKVSAALAVTITAIELLFVVVALRPMRVRFDLVFGVLVGCLALSVDILAVLNSTSSDCQLAGSVVELVAMTSVLLFDVLSDMWYPTSSARVLLRHRPPFGWKCSFKSISVKRKSCKRSHPGPQFRKRPIQTVLTESQRSDKCELSKRVWYLSS